MISDIDETVKELIIKELSELGLSSPQQYEISFDTPDREWEQRISKLTINLYLYDLAENHDLRDHEPLRQYHPDRKVTIRMPPARFDCKYLVTIWSATQPVDTAQEHLLLGQVLWALFRNAIIPKDFWSGYLQHIDFDFKIPTFTTQPNEELSVLGQFWSSLENRWKASFNYVVSVPIDLGKPIFTHAMVTTKMPSFELKKKGVLKHKNGNTSK